MQRRQKVTLAAAGGLAGVAVMAAVVLGALLQQGPSAATRGMTPGAGLTCRTYTSTDVPKTIPDKDVYGVVGVVTSTLSVADTDNVGEIMVSLTISHTYVGNLYLTLVSPDGTRVVIIDQVDSVGDNFKNTKLFDSASTSIDTVYYTQAPFTGDWQPSNPLSAMTGEGEDGTWRLRIEDRMHNNTGSLRAWSLEICGDAGAISTATDTATPTPSHTPTATPTQSPTPTQTRFPVATCLAGVTVWRGNPGGWNCLTGTPNVTPALEKVTNFGSTFAYTTNDTGYVIGQYTICWNGAPIEGLDVTAYEWIDRDDTQGAGCGYYSVAPLSTGWPEATVAPTSNVGQCPPPPDPPDEVIYDCRVDHPIHRGFVGDRLSSVGIKGAGLNSAATGVVSGCGSSPEQELTLSLTVNGCIQKGYSTGVPDETDTPTPSPTPTPSLTPTPTKTPTPTATGTTQPAWITEIHGQPVPTGTATAAPCMDWNLRSGCGYNDSFIELAVHAAMSLAGWTLDVLNPAATVICSYTYRSDNYSWPLKTVWMDMGFLEPDEETLCPLWPITGTVKLYDAGGSLMDTRPYTNTSVTNSWCAVDWTNPAGAWAVCTPSPGHP